MASRRQDRSRSASRFRRLFAPPRPGSGEWLPLLLILLLAAVLAGELASPWRTEPDAPPGLAPRRLRPPAAPQIPAYPAILAAPLFRPDRAPGEGAASRGPGTSPTLQLLGVGGAPGSWTAVVKTADGVVRALRIRHASEGWTLTAADPAGATFAGPSGRARLAVGEIAGGAAAGRARPPEPIPAAAPPSAPQPPTESPS